MPHASCTVCGHPEREQIDSLLRTGAASLRELAERFALKKSALHRHRHHDDVAHTSKNIGEIQKIDKEIQKLIAAQTRAKRKRDMSAVLAISRELRNWHGLRTKALAVASASQPEQNDQEVMGQDEALQLAIAILETSLARGDEQATEWLEGVLARISTIKNAQVVSAEPETDEKYDAD